MPYVIPYVVGALEAIGVGAAAATVIATIVVTAVEIVALSLVSKLLAPKTPGAMLSNGSAQEYTGTVEARRIAYGLNLLSGMNAVPPWCHGTNNQMLDQVLVLAGHQCSAITDCYANQEKIPTANIGAITGALSDGLVNTGTYASKLWIRRHTGGPGEAVDYILNQAWPSYWDSSHIGVGLCKIFMQYQYDTTGYATGKPEIRALVAGKLLYDPRLDTSAGANPFSATYQVYSNNAALCVLDYIIDPVLGVGESTSRIPWALWVAAANLCDEAVAIPGSLTQPRYTCNTTIDCTADWEDNIRQLSGAFQGATLYSGGQWIPLPGHNISSSFAIVDDDVIGAIDYQTAFPYADRYNAVRGQFYDPLMLYAPNDYPFIRVTADETADGEGPVWYELNFPTCINQYEAQRNAIIKQRQSRRKKSWTFQGGYRLYSIRPGEFGTFSYSEWGISNQPVKCVGWKMDGKSMSMQIILQEVNSADWNDPATVTYQTTTTPASPATVTYIADPVGSLTAVSAPGGITFAWTLPAVWHSNLQVELLEAPTNNIAGASVVWRGVNTGIYLQKSDTVARYYWTRVRNLAGNTLSVTNPAGATSGLVAGGSRFVGPAWTENFAGTVQAVPPMTNNYQKTGAVNGTWDSAVYSSEAYEACFVAFTATANNTAIMIGLNTDPATDASYTSIDYAWYLLDNGTLQIRESSTPVYSSGTYVAGDRFEITYDGSRVSYIKNNAVVQRTSAPGQVLALDSSFLTTGASVSGLSFGPLGVSAKGVGNLLSTADWTVGTSGTQGNYVDVVSSGTASSIVLGGAGSEPLGPYGTSDPLWKCNAGAGAAVDGGWNNSNNGALGDLLGIDPGKTYRHAVWVRRHGTAAGFFYFGCDSGGGTTTDLGGGVDANPYWLGSIALSAMTVDKWYLAVGFTHGQGYSGSSTALGGLFDPVTGSRIGSAATEFKQTSGESSTSQRCFLYAAVNALTFLYFARPRCEMVDGNEPTIAQLLSPDGILAYLDQVDSPQIVANAATLVHAAQATAVSGAALSHIPVNLTNSISLTFTPSVSCTLRCHFTGTFTFTDGGAGASVVQMGVYNLALAIPWVYQLPVNAAASSVTSASFAQSVDIACTGGASITIAAGFSKLHGADSFVMNYGDLHVEEIRR